MPKMPWGFKLVEHNGQMVVRVSRWRIFLSLLAELRYFRIRVTRAP